MGLSTSERKMRQAAERLLKIVDKQQPGYHRSTKGKAYDGLVLRNIAKNCLKWAEPQ